MEAALSHGDSLAHPEVQAALHQTSAAPLRNFAKDLDYVLEAAAQSDLQLSATTSAREAVRAATEANLDHIDWAAVAGRMRLKASRPERARSRGVLLPSQTEVEAAPVFTSVEALEAALPPLWHEDECAMYMQVGYVRGSN